MDEPTSHEPIFRVAAPLPRGPHGLTREQVRASQRERLIAATVELVGEHGYADVSVHAIAGRASVSVKTFYEQFAGKRECLLAGYDEFTRVLYTRMAPRDVAPGADLAATVRRILGAYLVTMDENLRAARAFLVELNAAGASARARRREINAIFAYGLREQHRVVREDTPGFDTPAAGRLPRDRPRDPRARLRRAGVQHAGAPARRPDRRAGPDDRPRARADRRLTRPFARSARLKYGAFSH